MIVIGWVGQILLFFVFWRLLHWLLGKAVSQLSLTSMVLQIVLNILVIVVWLVVLSNLHSVWGLMMLSGAVVGVFTGEMAVNGRKTRG